MPSISEWFGVYSSLRDNVGATAAATEATRQQLLRQNEEFNTGFYPYIRSISESLITMTARTGGAGDPNLLLIDATLKRLSDQGLIPLITAFINVDTTIAHVGGGIRSILEIFLADLGFSLAKISQDSRSTAGLQKEVLEKINLALASMLEESSPAAIPIIISIIKLLPGILTAVGVALPLLLEAYKQYAPETWTAGIIEKLDGYVDHARGAGQMVLDILTAPMGAMVESVTTDMVRTLQAHAPATIDSPIKAATDAIMMGYKFGMTAHALSLAGEFVSPLKALGIGQVASYLVDLAGFKPIASAVSGSMISGAITRPMRWWGNAVFTPEIPSLGDLETFVRKRVIDLQTYTGYLQYHGFDRERADFFSQTVWRDFTIRDIALAMEDTTIDEAWLLPRIMRIGYDDDDADRITRSLLQRGMRSQRASLISAAKAAAVDGVITLDDYRNVLEGLGLREQAIALEMQAAQIAAHRDYVNQAISTYRKQVVNGVIDVSAFSVALYSLGLPGERIELLIADVEAQLRPRIVREEEAEIREAMREAQRFLIPQYRELFELGVIAAGDYKAALTQLGISDTVASQAVALAQMRLSAVATRTRNRQAERMISEVLDEREELYVDRYRKGEIDAAGLAGALHTLGISAERVAVLVERERVRRIPPISKPPAPPAEAKERYILDLQRQAVIYNYRYGRIDESELYDELIKLKLSAEEAEATVALETSRKK